MNLIVLPDMSLFITVLSDIIVLILTYIGVTYHIECDMAVMKYLALANNLTYPMTCPSMVLFYWKVYGKEENSAM